MNPARHLSGAGGRLEPVAMSRESERIREDCSEVLSLLEDIDQDLQRGKPRQLNSSQFKMFQHAVEWRFFAVLKPITRPNPKPLTNESFNH